MGRIEMRKLDASGEPQAPRERPQRLATCMPNKQTTHINIQHVKHTYTATTARHNSLHACLASADLAPQYQILAVPVSMDVFRTGTRGVSTNGVTANFIFVDRGTFWVILLTYFPFSPICQNSLHLQRPH